MNGFESRMTRQYCLLFLLALFGASTRIGSCSAFQSSRRYFPTTKPSVGSRELYHPNSNGNNINDRRILLPSHGSVERFDRSIRLSAGFLDDLQGFFKRFTTKASASHILVKGGAEAANKLDDLKVEIMAADPELTTQSKFARAASQYSECPSASKGGDLGSFGPGQMVKEFDTVVFNDDIGVVHGPIRTQFGYHLIYIRDRTE